MVSSIQADKLPKHPAISEVREAKIAALRKAIANGTYQIPSGDVADKIIEDIIRKP